MSSFEMSSSWPSAALVVGVMIGSGNFWFSTIPSGISTPQIVRFPALYSLHACPERYPRMTISTLKGSHLCPTVTIGSGTAIFQLGRMSAVASRNLAAIWLRTCPLKGIPFGSTTSNAEMRSDTTMTRYSLPMLYTSRTLPT